MPRVLNRASTPPSTPSPSCSSWQRRIWTLCEREMSLSILNPELAPPDEWKTLPPCVQETVISAGSGTGWRKRTAVCLQALGQYRLAGCSLLSVRRSSTYLARCDTASATAKLAQSTRLSVSPHSIRFPLNAANTLNRQERPQFRWKLHSRKEILRDLFFFFSPSGCNRQDVCRDAAYPEQKV